jgi:hypothetical protein
MNATNIDISWSTVATVPPCGGRVPSQKQATMNSSNARPLTRLVTFCTAAPPRMPTHWMIVNSATTVSATTCSVRASGKRRTEYCPTISATAAVVPQVEIQSLQPTTKPA